MCEFVFVSECYAIVCAWCKRTIELRGTTDPVLMGETSHTACETCAARIMSELEV
jgi:DNA-directed RNA polymerase subunit RPC12/RpoP